MADAPLNSGGLLGGSRPVAPEPRSPLPWILAGVVVLITLLAPPDAYAASLVLSNIKMSESANLSGGKLTYLDGEIANHGTRTVSGITVQVAFRSAPTAIVQKETMPLNLIRMTDPYIDTQPVSAAPLKPGESRSFRLIFEHVAADWDGQYPEVRVIQVTGS